MIEVKNVTKKYGDFTAVKNVNFTVNDGEIVGFLGPNGAGKSTTMNVITGYIEPTEGTVIINGYDILKKPAKAKKQIGYMPEGVPLYYDLTVREFVTYLAELKKVGKKEKKAEVDKAIEETGLKDVEKKLIRNLSRGYKQRVSMAGALVGNPDVLILDEPTVGLDPKQIIEIRNLIKELGKEHTVILSSHILSEVSQICQKVVIINKGEIIAIDTPEHLEKQTQEKDAIILTVEDIDKKMENIKELIPDVKSCKEIKDNKDGTKQYMIEAKENVDLRKQLFDVLPKNNITIFELKKAESSLEDAFLSLIDKNTNKSSREKGKVEVKIEEKSVKNGKERNEKNKKNNTKPNKDVDEAKVKKNDNRKQNKKGGKK